MTNQFVAVDEIRKSHENSIKSSTTPGDLETARRTEKICSRGRKIHIDAVSRLAKSVIFIDDFTAGAHVTAEFRGLSCVEIKKSITKAPVGITFRVMEWAA